MEKKRQTQLIVSSWSLCWLLSSPGLWAQAPPVGTQLGEVELFGAEEDFTIRAATKTDIPISKAPGSVTVITAREIRESGAQTIPELLRLVAGVNVRWNPMVQSIGTRSFGQSPFTSRVLLLIDGVPYNSWEKGGFPQHPGLDFFVLQNIKRLEIVRGPGSSLYGENAYWGVINIVTLGGEDLAGGKVEIGGGDLRNQSLGAVYGRKLGAGAFLVSGRTQRGQLPVRFWFDEVDSEVKGTDIFLKGKIRGFEVSYYRHQDKVDGFNLPGFIPGTVLRSAKTIEQKVDIFALKLNHEWPKGLTFGSDVSYARRHGSRCAACHAAPQNPAYEGTVDHGFQLIGDFRVGFKMIPGARQPGHDILLGVEARRVDVGDPVDQLLTPEETTAKVVLAYTKLAAYVQDQISLAEDRFRLTVGARFDDSNDLFDSEVSPRLAAVFTPTDKLVLRTGWSTAFRFPNFNELYQDSFFLSLERGRAVIPIQIFEPNPGLEPEEIRTFELGLEYQFNPQVSVKMDLFQSTVKDFIVLAFRQPPAGPSRLRSENHPGEAEVRGGELELRFRPSTWFHGFVNWSYQEQEQKDRRTDSTGLPYEFVYAPENKLNAGLYFGPFAGFRTALEAKWIAERYGPSFWNRITNPGGGPAVLDDYTLLSCKLSYDPPLRWGNSGQGLRLSATAKNLLDDEEIVETFLPIDMRLPGRTYFGSLEFRF